MHYLGGMWGRVLRKEIFSRRNRGKSWKDDLECSCCGVFDQSWLMSCVRLLTRLVLFAFVYFSFALILLVSEQMRSFIWTCLRSMILMIFKMVTKMLEVVCLGKVGISLFKRSKLVRTHR